MRKRLLLFLPLITWLGWTQNLVLAQETATSISTETAPSCHPSDPSPEIHAGATPMPLLAAQLTSAAPMPAKVLEQLPTDPQIDVQETTNAQGEHVKIALFKDLLIDKIYPSMHGPWKQQPLRMLPPSQSQWVWITGYRAEVLDSKTGEASQEFMCHTNLRVMGTPGAPDQFQNERAELSISQGQKEVNFPPGFALRVENIPERQMNVMVMVLNNNYANIHRNLNFKSTVRYYDDSEAEKRRLIPLVQTSAYTACLTDPKEISPGEYTCTAASPPEMSRWLDGRQRTGHWIVPPGRQAFTQDVTKILNLSYDTTLHYIWMHVHPYAESLELKDLNTGKTVWKGSVNNPKDPNLAQVLTTDTYSSTDGIPLYKDHHYSLTTIYNNRSKHDVDAMAALWMYIREKT